MTRAVTWLLKLYKGMVSPYLPASCRFVPSCSEYAAQAVAERGALQGTLLALWRVVRCNPFVRGGYDPVPGKAARPMAAERPVAGAERILRNCKS